MIRWRIDIGTRFGVPVGVDIEDTQYDGSIIEVDGSGSPIVVTMGQQNTDPFRKINASYIDLELWSHTPDMFEDLFKRNTGRWRIFLYVNEQLESAFIPVTDATSEPVHGGRYKTRIKGANLSLLKAGKAGDILTNSVYRRLEAIRLLYASLFDIPVVDGTVFYPQGTDQSRSSLYQQYIQTDRIKDESPYDAIQRLVMKNHQVRIARGKVFILPVAETFTGHEYNQGGYVESLAYLANHTAEWKNRSQSKKGIHFRDGVRRVYLPDPLDNIVPGGDFEKGDFHIIAALPKTPGFPIEWNVETGIGDRVEAVDINAGGLTKAWRIQVNPPLAAPDIFTTQSVDVLEGYRLSVGMMARFNRGFDWEAKKSIHTQIRTTNHVLLNEATSVIGGVRIGRDPEKVEWVHISEVDLNSPASYLSIQIAEGEGFASRSWMTPPLPDSGPITFKIRRPVTTKGAVEFGQQPAGIPTVDIAQFSVDVTDEEGEIIERVETLAGTEGDVYEYEEHFGDGPTSANRGAIFTDIGLQNPTDQWTYLGDNTSSLKDLESQYLHSELSEDRNRISGQADVHDLLTLVDGKRINYLSVDYRYATSSIELVELDDPEFISDLSDEEEATGGSFIGRPQPEPRLPDSEERSIGYITQDLDGRYTEIPVYLRHAARDGIDYNIVREAPKMLIPFTPTVTAQSGADVIHIESQYIEAPEGSFIVKAAGQEEAEVFVHEEKVRVLNEEKLPELEQALNDLEAIDLTELEEALDALELELDNLNDVILPGLQNDLDTLETDLNTLNTVTLPDLQDELDALELELANSFPITETQISDDAISSPKIQANAITAIKINALAVTTGKVNTSAITAIKIATDAVTANKIQAGAVIAGKLAADSVVANNIQSDAVTANKIAADAVTANKILAGAVTTAKLAANAVTANKILAGTITSNEINVDELTSNSAFIADIFAQNATIAGTLTMGGGGDITNSNSDFSITSSGISIAQSATFLGGTRSYTVSGLGSMWGHSSSGLHISSLLDTPINLDAGGAGGNNRVIVRGNMRVRNVSESNRNSPTPQSGDIIFNTTSNRFNGWNGTEWRNFE